MYLKNIAIGGLTDCNLQSGAMFNVILSLKKYAAKSKLKQIIHL